MAFDNAYKLNINFTVNDKENPNAPFTDRFSRNKTIARTGLLPGGGLPGFLEIGLADQVIYAAGGDLNSEGLLIIENLDPENYFDYGPDVAGAIAPLGRCLPGEGYPIRLVPGLTLRGMANTAPCRARVRIYEA